MRTNKDQRKTRTIAKLGFIDAAVKLVGLGVRNSKDFKELCRNKMRPADVPSAPHSYYPEFESWANLVEVGIDNASDDVKQANIPDYATVKSLVKRYQITSKEKWRKAIKEELLSPFIPSNPEYYDEFEGWDLFLAIKTRFISYDEAKKIVRGFGLTTVTEWRKFCRDGLRPPYIPALPNRDYDEFISWHDFLIEDDFDAIYEKRKKELSLK